MDGIANLLIIRLKVIKGDAVFRIAPPTFKIKSSLGSHVKYLSIIKPSLFNICNRVPREKCGLEQPTNPNYFYITKPSHYYDLVFESP